LALPWPCDVALREDALTLLRSSPDGCAAVVFFDPQYRGALDHLKLGNEGARQQGRYKLPAMSSDYIDACGREISRILRPSGYLALWADTFNVCQAHHLRIADAIQVVDLIAWDNLRLGMGKRSRRRGDYLSCCRRRRSRRRHGVIAASPIAGPRRSISKFIRARSIRTQSRST
jgi:site-specific DNA-methyltransferase (adenine-specific)